MTSQISSKVPPISPRLEQRLTKLRQQLIGFQVRTNQGDFIGTVTDLVVDENYRLNLLIQQLAPSETLKERSSNQPEQNFLVRTKLIQHVYRASHTLSINLNLSDFVPNSDIAMTATPDSSDAFGTVIVQQDDRTAPVQDTLENQPVAGKALSPDVLQEETIRLLAERLKVDYERRKVGEVIVRKEVQTELIQVPVRREKLIVEQVSPDNRQLAEIDLGQGDLSGLELIDSARTSSTHSISQSTDHATTVTGEFTSPKTLVWLLDAIARQRNHGCKRIHITLELNDAEHAELYQSWFESSSASNSNSRSNGR
jgi:stress response protein YsnF